MLFQPYAEGFRAVKKAIQSTESLSTTGVPNGSAARPESLYFNAAAAAGLDVVSGLD